jgi:hypothetical protein
MSSANEQCLRVVKVIEQAASAFYFDLCRLSTVGDKKWYQSSYEELLSNIAT